jgi:citrate/tricarballylate utilization protein
VPEFNIIDEGARVMRICNSCRYCEGFCAVFPAMERRLTFAEADLNYLANLCHNCGECYYACQYAPPHEFAVNVPKLMAELRLRSYKKYSWPPLFGSLSKANGILAAACIAMALAYGNRDGTTFYEVMSHRAMVTWFGAASVFIGLAFAFGLRRFWHDTGSSTTPNAVAQGLRDALTLHYLGGSAYPHEQPSNTRRWFHHFTFYGFALCFASTVTAAFDHYVLRLQAPYALTSLPVVLGSAGGFALIVGTTGLLWLKGRRNPQTQDQKQTGMEIAFLALLFLSGASGLLLLAMRESSVMADLLLLHLAIVFALLITLPYGKFVHAIYRSAALVKYASERLPSKESGIRR